MHANLNGFLIQLKATHMSRHELVWLRQFVERRFKLTWLVLGEDPAARSHRVEQFTAL